MNRRQKIIVSITGIFIVLLALVGLTYAYFLTRITGNENDKSISVTTANLELVYGDGNNLVTASNIEPGDAITPKTFTVTNNGNATVENFNIYLEDVRNSLSRKTDMIYTITCKNITEGATSTTCEDFVVVENENNGTELVFPSVVTIIGRDTLDPATEDTEAEVHEYTITLTYKEMNVDQSEDMNKEVSAKVNIYDNKTKFLANEIMLNARKTGTFTYNKTEYIDPSLQDGTTYTIPAHATSLENERVLTYTMDDYGTSYYFRGNVEDNYVNYAGMCWRIVRIEGDGSIKITLAAQKACSAITSADTGSAFIGTGDYGYIIDNAGANIADYENSKNRTSSMKYKFNIFLNGGSFESYDTETKTYTGWSQTNLDKLKSEKICIGDTDSAYTSTGVLITEPEKEFQRYYKNYIRLYIDQIATLMCDTSGNKTTTAKIYPLTVDEIVYAGGKVDAESNYTYYLRENATSNYWWTVSPAYSEFNVRAFNVGRDGFIIGYSSENVSDDYVSLRPAVSLASGAKLATGDGTKNNPYTIQ